MLLSAPVWPPLMSFLTTLERSHASYACNRPSGVLRFFWSGISGPIVTPCLLDEILVVFRPEEDEIAALSLPISIC